MDLSKKKNIALLIFSGGAMALIASYYTNEPIVLIVSSGLFFCSILVWRFGYFILPLITDSVGLVCRSGEYEMNSAQDVLIKKGDSGYYASMYLGVELRHSSAFATDSRKSALMDSFERAVSSLKFATKISLVACNLDMGRYIEGIEEKRSLAEQRKGQVKKNSAEYSILDREIRSYNSQLKRLTGGQRPMQVLAYAQTTARGFTKEQAISKVRAQALEAAAILSNALASNVSILKGEEVLRCFEWEKISPASKADIEDALF